MTITEVHIGTKFGDKGIFDNVRAASCASVYASNIAKIIASDSSLIDISASVKKWYILDHCAALIAVLARISIYTCEKQPQSDYSVPDDCENLTDYAGKLWLDVISVSELVGLVNSHGEKIERLEGQICDSIFTACKIVAGLGVTDLEPYILEQIR